MTHPARPSYVLSDWRDAPWLPRCRRFLPALFIALSEIASLGHQRALDIGCSLLFLGLRPLEHPVNTQEDPRP